MSGTLKLINDIISDAKPDNYTSISHNTYLRNLTKISDNIITEYSGLKTKILNLNIPDNQKLEILKELML